MNLLALETSTDLLSIAVLAHGRMHASISSVGQRHAELALDAIDALLVGAGLDRGALDGIAFGAGPGSFTGLRIATGIAQGLALGLGIPILGVSTLAALAEPSDSQRVFACLDARMGEVYCAAFERMPAGWRTAIEPGVFAPAAVPVPPGDGWVGLGTGFAAHGERLAARLGGVLARVDPDAVPTAAAIVRLAEPRFAAGEGADPGGALPIYIRDKVALKTSERR
jgi:tRNA threonylcarbamoyladenosine biosynthesis protein TsaB